MNRPAKILVTGACGQIWKELVKALRARYELTNVVAADIHDRSQMKGEGPRYTLDVMNSDAFEWIVEALRVTEIYHLAAVLSASGEKKPILDELANAITRQLKDFKICYEPDFRQEIAETWTWTIDDLGARLNPGTLFKTATL